MVKNWLITGGCGFIGTSLIQHLLQGKFGVNIRVLDNLSVGSRDDLAGVSRFRELGSDGLFGQSEGVELIQGDIRNYQDCLNACAGREVIVHLAANTGVALSVENPLQDMEVNVAGMVNILEAARRHNVSRFIFASSGAPLGEVEPPIHEEKVPRPVSPYGASKLAGEGYCSAYYRTFGIRTVSLRFGNVYGPRSKHKSSVVAKFFRNALDGKPLEVYGDGCQTRDFIYIDDLTNAILLSLRADTGGEVFQIATHKETTVNTIAELIQRIVESETGIKTTIVHRGNRLGDVRRNYSDISKAKSVLGFEPVYDLQKGLRETFEYFRREQA
ncbi:MAG: NAD-dependent epimerase/dehydratase family protein [Thermodesulfovibrionales bacterium]|jgi:UDP-glucose 4-epimerase